jgi:hypothetical protein
MAFGDKIWYGDGHEGWVVDKNTIYRAYPLRIEQVDAFLKGWKECLEQMGKNPYTPKRILRSGPATIVFWEDGTKTVVKCAANENDNTYAAFTAALAIKIFGSNSAVKKIVKSKTEEAK